jgi:hypothetical protein
MRFRLRTLLYAVFYGTGVVFSAWLVMFLFAPGDGMGTLSVAFACIGAISGGYILSRLRQEWVK